jgi:hypothetical protein
VYPIPTVRQFDQNELARRLYDRGRPEKPRSTPRRRWLPVAALAVFATIVASLLVAASASPYL